MFFQDRIQEEIYMEQPQFYTDQNNLSKVCRLNKALFGLKQSSRIWNQELSKDLEIGGLGMRITRGQNRIALDQELYIENILDGFGIKTSKPISTLMIGDEKFTAKYC